MKIREIIVTPVISVGAYHAGDAVGGLMEFEDAASVYSLDGTISKVVVMDLAKQLAVLDLWLFDRTFTATADHAAFDVSDADLEHCIGVVRITAAHYASASDNAVATTSWDSIFPFVLEASGNGSIYGQLRCNATPTYASVGDLKIRLAIQK